MAQGLPGDAADSNVVSIENPEKQGELRDADTDESPDTMHTKARPLTKNASHKQNNTTLSNGDNKAKVKSRLWIKNASHKQNNSLHAGNGKANVSDSRGSI